MAQLPPVRRLVVEDFQQEKKWIGKLFQPLNTFMEQTLSAFARNLTLKENVAADILTVTLSSVPTLASPAAIAWSLKKAPVAIFVGTASRLDGASFTASAAIWIQWQFGASGLQITNLVGITPTSSIQYSLTLVAFTG